MHAVVSFSRSFLGLVGPPSVHLEILNDVSLLALNEAACESVVPVR